MITPYGYSTIAKVTLISLLIAAVAHFLPTAIGVPLLAIAVFLVLFALQFFRDPSRTPPSKDGVVVSPADGKVVLIQDVEHHFFGGSATQVSIFMSPINVHVNRIPLTGKVTHLKYIEGDYIAAFDHASGERNERTEIGIENGRVKVFFKQISGYVARRIVCDLKPNDEVQIGERFGMIKFGSRVDVFLPKSAVIRVRLGDNVTAGETILATC